MKRRKKPEQIPQVPLRREVVTKEKEIVREIVKIRCRYCGNLYDQRENKCPRCGGRG